ncbi:MAG: AgmX/PglI C-terminal domain-containing protein, partial [Myxococcota bacterium]
GQEGMMTQHALWAPAFALTFIVGCEKGGETTPPGDAAAAEPAPMSDDDEDADEDEGDESLPTTSTVEEEAYLTLALFEQTVNANLQDVVDCYGDAKAANAKLGTKLVGAFKIDGEGKVTEVTAGPGSDIDDAGMLTCVRDRAQGWGLIAPPDHEATSMNFPFDFGG